ncbi:MAG: FG-GAP repeat protein, partial [Planctomycetes bacterium]|nr:FG-GAP repeat protein [Planctomycetota bacterium]
DEAARGRAGGAFAGTPVYAAPERLRGGDGDRLGPQTDVYSLGVTLYELLTLHAPFAGNTTDEVLRRIESGDLPDLRRQAPHVSSDLATVVQKAMETDPRHRYATAGEFADDLARLLRYEPVRARPAGPVRRFAKLLRRNRRVVTAGVAGAVVVAAALWPFVAHARANEVARREAAALLQQARTSLLSPASLHTAWTRALAGSGQQPLLDDATRGTHLEALEQVVTRYDAVLATWSGEAGARAERDAVQTALATIRARRVPLPEPGTLATDDEPAGAPGDAFGGGLSAFLVGDSATCRSRWQSLGPAFEDHPLLNACRALQLANDGFAEQAYPRLFHATRAFPAASALALAMATAALDMGDTELAEEWLGRTPEQTGNRIAARRRRLLAADLSAARGDVTTAAAVYRELSASDGSDPIPRQRIAALALQRGDATTARRLLERILARWPDQATARLQLAELDLQQRRLAAYLAHVRWVLALDRRRVPSAAAHRFEAIVRFGGLDALLDDAAGHPARISPRRTALPLGNWLPVGCCAAIETAMRTVAVVDRYREQMQAVDPRPIGTWLRTAWTSALALPALTETLPFGVRIAILAGLPATFGSATDLATSVSAPFVRILGDEARIFQPPWIVRPHPEARGVAYAQQLVRAGDIDGDTLQDLCIAHSGGSGESATARIEIRSLNDGELLRTILDTDGDRSFARGLDVVTDVDGDGCQDLAIGSPAASAEGGRGGVELRSGRTGAELWRRLGDTPRFGEAVAALSDFDGDGCADVLVGVPNSDPHGRGRAVVCSGRDGAILGEFAPEDATAAFGRVVAALGDVDGDGRSDFLVTGTDGNAPGYAAVCSGRDLESLAKFAEESPLEDFGADAVGIGDVDEDGHADFAIAAPAYTGRAGRAGRVLLISGRDGSLFRVIAGEHRGECFGMALCALPHWLRDSRPALAISAFRGGPTGRGYVRVFDAATGDPLQTIAGNPSVNLFGGTLVDLGDRDGDGLRDLGIPLQTRDGLAGMFAISFAMTRPR